jgi:exopolyphosphatase / guanosine-5'-triphosphate,3'-diphosphate pyrophosphatase
VSRKKKGEKLKFAAIDIGSNAIRMQVSNVNEFKGEYVFKKLEYVRFPLRLGKDVFTTKSISPANEERFVKLMQAFKILLDLYEVDDYFACATSAMRESKNGDAIVKRVKNELNLKIHVIDGNKEAELINKSILAYLDEKCYLHIDVGGGSTELNIYMNKQKMTSKSFKLGSVRRMEHHDSPAVWKSIQQWVEEHIKGRYGNVIAVGTGGNINKIAEIGGKKPGKTISLARILNVQQILQAMTYEERMYQLQLNPDRADVILPASDIYISVMKWANSKRMLVPDVGLKDGLMLSLFEKHLGGK